MPISSRTRFTEIYEERRVEFWLHNYAYLHQLIRRCLFLTRTQSIVPIRTFPAKFVSDPIDTYNI